MSKEYLEALRNLGAVLGDLEIDKDTMLPKMVLSGDRAKNYKIVEQALQRLEAIDNSEYSEALECLENNRTAIPYAIDYRTIKQALIKAQEQEKEYVKLEGQINYLTEVVTEFQKVLKILNEKEVSLFWLKRCKTVNAYNLSIGLENNEYRKLTEEEFELLKRYVCKSE